MKEINACGAFSNWGKELGVVARARLGLNQLGHILTIVSGGKDKGVHFRRRLGLLQMAERKAVILGANKIYPHRVYATNRHFDVWLGGFSPVIVEYQGEEAVLVNLKQASDFTRGALIARLVEHGVKEGIPLAPFFQTKKGDQIFICHNSPFALQRLMPGTSISAKDVTYEQLTSAIDLLSAFHKAMETVKVDLHGVDRFKGSLNAFYNNIDQRWSALLIEAKRQGNNSNICQRILENETLIVEAFSISKERRSACDSVNLQYVHGDSHIRNFLFLDDKASALIDYEMMDVGSKYDDYARFFVFAGVDGCYFDHDRIYKLLEYMVDKEYISKKEVPHVLDAIRNLFLKFIVNYWPVGVVGIWGKKKEGHHSFIEALGYMLNAFGSKNVRL